MVAQRSCTYNCQSATAAENCSEEQQFLLQESCAALTATTRVYWFLAVQFTMLGYENSTEEAFGNI